MLGVKQCVHVITAPVGASLYQLKDHKWTWVTQIELNAQEIMSFLIPVSEQLTIKINETGKNKYTTVVPNLYSCEAHIEIKSITSRKGADSGRMTWWHSKQRGLPRKRITETVSDGAKVEF